MKIKNKSLTDTAYVYKLGNLQIPENSTVSVPSYYTEAQVRDAISPFENLVLLQGYIVTYDDLGVSSGSVVSIDELPISSELTGSLELEFSYSDFASVSKLIGNIAANVDIEELKIVVDSPFDGGAAVTVGDAVQPDRLAANSNSELAFTGIYDMEITYSYSVDTDINLYMSGNPTTGSGKVLIFIS